MAGSSASPYAALLMARRGGWFIVLAVPLGVVALGAVFFGAILVGAVWMTATGREMD